eukprot:TRINITY_DN20086_c1_g1_i3.p1 TRINITY_DN20086_c1_g1~~TRINITY_DN20086_c1_g1_i3.p1  ORF type:complete len:602 (+),score=21.69 TRINITY_DN20086_c1_g1_i3:206-2011(+)
MRLSYCCTTSIGAMSIDDATWEIRTKMQEFEAHGLDERRLRFRNVSRSVLLFSILSTCTIAAASPIKRHATQMVWANIMSFIGTFGVITCMLLIIDFPPNELDLEKLFQERPCLRRSLSFIVAVAFINPILRMPHPFHLVPLLLGLFSACEGLRCLPERQRPRFGVWLIFVLNMALLSYTAADLGFAFVDGSSSGVGGEVPSYQFAVCAAVSVGGFLYAVAYWLQHRAGLWRWHSSLLFMKMMRAWILTRGIRDGLFGLFATMADGSTTFGVERMATGIAHVLPCLVVIAVGQGTIFEMVACRLTRNRDDQERDGAFLAGLLDTGALALGLPWWSHRADDDKDTRFSPTDHRYHFKQGRIVRISDESFFVRSGREVREFPIARRNASWQDLLDEGRASLRLIEWQCLTQELFTGRICGGVVDKSLFHFSRPVRDGEVIDFFISHSWYDDPNQKYQSLTQLAENFMAKHKRYPTFWFDKVCIDQDNIADCLRVLPVKVMTCSRFLMILGPTYLQRLWCAWELCLLLAFMEVNVAMEKIHLVKLDEEGTAESKALLRMLEFDIMQAHCYDPNEESRVRNVISSVGVERFNSKVQALGRKLRGQ